MGNAAKIKHTTTPWTVKQCTYEPAAGSRFELRNEHGPVADIIAYRHQDQQDPAFIVRACNSHEILIEALEDLLKEIGNWMPAETGACLDAHKALDYAKGE